VELGKKRGLEIWANLVNLRRIVGGFV